MSEANDNELETKTTAEIEPAEPKDGVLGGPHGSLPAAILGGILGLIAGIIIACIICALFGKVGYIPYLILPLCICFGTVILRGKKELSSLVALIILSVAGAAFLPAVDAAYVQAVDGGVSLFSLPLLAFSHIGEANLLTNFTFSSACVIPAVQTIIGICISWQIFRYYRIIKGE